MIAIETIRSDILPFPPQLVNRRAKLTRSRLRRVSRPRSGATKNPDELACSQVHLRPVPPAAPPVVPSRPTNGATTSTNAAQKTSQRKTRSGNREKNDNKVKLPNLKSKEDRKSKNSLSNSTKSGQSKSEKAKGRRQSVKNDSAEGGDKPKRTKSVYILEAIRPNNVYTEKEKFMRLRGHYDPQFEYDNPATEKALKSYSKASDKLIHLAMKIIENALDRYGTYEAFEEATAGERLTEAEFTHIFKEFVSAEGLGNQIQLNLNPDLLSRAVMTRLRSRPTMNVNSKVLREGWAKGLLQHEIGTHYIRSANNRYQPWHNNRGRKRHGLLPMNPTEEGLASLHSVLGRANPSLWRSAMLYYTIYQASIMPFSRLFEHLGRFVRCPEVRWDYCMRAKRGQVDTSQPGCFNKDQVYLSGTMQILRFRHEIDFHALVKLGRVAYQDVDRLRHEAILADGVVSVPLFMVDLETYLRQLDEIRLKNRLTDKELCEAFPSMTACI